MQIVAIEVVLEGVQPVVRRALEVPLSIRLNQLHLVIQAALGWDNSHLYQFCVGEPYQLDGKCWVIPDFLDRPEDMSANEYTLDQAITLSGNEGITYLYDFGDDWRHSLKIGKTKGHELGVTYPLLLDIEGTCPPEDVGGAWGYETFLEAMQDKKHEDHKELKQWYGGVFKPNDPPADKLRDDVLRLARLRFTGEASR